MKGFSFKNLYGSVRDKGIGVFEMQCNNKQFNDLVILSHVYWAARS